MLDIVKDSLIKFFIAAVASAVFAPLMIAFLYKAGQVVEVAKTKAGLSSNDLFRKIMNTEKTNGTPNMGGILIWIIVPLVSFITLKLNAQISVLLTGFILFGLWGLLDVLFINSIKGGANEKLRTMQETFEWRMGKLGLAIILNTAVMYLLYRTGTLSTISLLNLLTFSFTPIVMFVTAVVGQFAIYSAELTDGLDAHLMGIFNIVLVALAVLLLVQQKYEYVPFIGICLGVVAVDLYFNIPPARFWNGGPGAMPLGFALFYIALVTDNLVPYFLMSSVMWITMASSMIQILSVKFFKKRIFRIAPIHHHFQAIGWPKEKVTMRFWLFTSVLSVLGILIGLL